MATVRSSKKGSSSAPGARRYVKRDSDARAKVAPSGGQYRLIGAGGYRRAVTRRSGITISGPAEAVEDYLDALEINRRLTDPANAELIPWEDLKARLGLAP